MSEQPCSTDWICKATTLDAKCPKCGAEFPTLPAAAASPAADALKALDCLFIAVDESIAGEVSAKVRAGFEAVAVVAEAKGVAASLEALEHMGACNERVAAERDALRETVRDLKDVDAFRLTKLEQFAATIERLTQDAEREGLEWLADAEKQAMELEYEADNAYRHAVFTLPQRTAAIASSIVQSIRHARADFTRRATPDTEGE